MTSDCYIFMAQKKRHEGVRVKEVRVFFCAMSLAFETSGNYFVLIVAIFFTLSQAIVAPTASLINRRFT